MNRLKRFITGAMAAVLSFTLAFGMTPSKEVKADMPEGTIYYGFSEFTNASQLVEGTNYLLLARRYGTDEAIAAIPEGSANVRIDSSFSASSGSEFCSLSQSYGKGVKVYQSGTGFDGCPGGAIVYLTSGTYKDGSINCSTNPGWYYGCNGGGVSFVGAFYTYSYKEGKYSADDITVTTSSTFKAPSSRTAISSSDIKVTVKVKGTSDVLEIPYFTFVDNIVDPGNGDYEITIDVGGVNKTVMVKAKEATPSGNVNESDRKIGGLTANATYVVTVDGTSEEVTADAEGCISAEKYSGKQITIVKKSQNTGYSDDSEPQTIEVPRYKAPTPGILVEGDSVSGFEPNAEYEIIVDDKHIDVIADDEGNVNLEDYSNKTVTIIKKSENEYEDDSEPQIIMVPKYKEATPSAAADAEDKVITGLVPNLKYEITVDGITTTVVADSKGVIDAADYSGKEVTIVRKAVDDNKFDSEAQIIQMPRYKQDTPKAVVDSKNGVIKGLIPGETYIVTADGKETEVIADEDGTIPLAPYLNKNISISKKGDEANNIDNSVNADLNIKDIKSGDVKKEIKKTASAPETTINNTGAYVLQNILSKYEIEKVNGGADAEIWLTVDDVTKNIASDDVKKITSKLKAEEFVGAYVDVSLYKRVGENAPVQVTELSSGKLSISFKIPETLLAAKGYERTYTVYRLHDGEVEQLVTEYNKDTQTVSFETDRFSVYAIAYTEKQIETPKVDTPKAEEPKVDSPKTGDRTPLAMIFFMMVISGMAIYTLRKDRKF